MRSDSQVPSTRPLLLLPFPTFPTPITPETISPEDEPLLTKIVVYTEHPDTIRRGGALGCIKNAAMDRASHPFLLATEGGSSDSLVLGLSAWRS
jgi:hypothetical protein